MKQLHDEYGTTIRIAPNEVVFSTGQAWEDIFGVGAKRSERQYPRDKTLYTVPQPGDELNIMFATDELHARIRMLLGPVFSVKSIEEQQDLINGYVNLLVEKLRTHAGTAQNAVAWFTWTTFDIIGDLTFGRSFDGLRDENYHPWVKVIFDGLKGAQIAQEFHRYGLLQALMLLSPREMLEARSKMIAYTKKSVDARLELGETERPDMVTMMLRENKKGAVGMTKAELYANAEVLVVAGSETTATLLGNLLFSLLTHPPKLKRLVNEVRNAFISDAVEEMNLKSLTSRLPYLNACINEALRHSPPGPWGMGRKTPDQGAVIDGHFMPPNTTVNIYFHAISRLKWNWHRPDEFLPERWMSDEEEGLKSKEVDKREAFHPWSYGPKTCLGKK